MKHVRKKFSRLEPDTRIKVVGIVTFSLLSIFLYVFQQNAYKRAEPRYILTTSTTSVINDKH